MPQTQERVRLDSWKEVAAYLKRDERTVQRWAAERGLPVHHTPGNRRGAVFAYQDEIEAWLAGSPTPAPPSQAAPGRASPARLRWEYVLALSLAATALLLAVRLWLPGPAARTGPPVRVTLAGYKLIAWDERGRESWSYVFPEVPSFLRNGQWTWADLKGDGGRQLLASIRFSDFPGGSTTASELDCFSAQGQRLWRFRPALDLSFQGRAYESPWIVRDLAVLAHPRGPATIWALIADRTWGYSWIARVDPATGRGQPVFVNDGLMEVLTLAESGGRPYLLAGGFSNQYDLGALAVLDAEQAFASAPLKPGTRFQCDRCSQGAPLKYLLFPRSELNTLDVPYPNSVEAIDVYGEELEISTAERSAEERHIFMFSTPPAVTLVSAAFSDTYWKEHTRLEQEGRIHHPAEACPERLHPKPIRLWTPQGGWTEVKVSPS